MIFPAMPPTWSFGSFRQDVMSALCCESVVQKSGIFLNILNFLILAEMKCRFDLCTVPYCIQVKLVGRTRVNK